MRPALSSRAATPVAVSFQDVRATTVMCGSSVAIAAHCVDNVLPTGWPAWSESASEDRREIRPRRGCALPDPIVEPARVRAPESRNSARIEHE